MTNERNSSIIDRLHVNNYHIHFIFQRKINADKYKIKEKCAHFSNMSSSNVTVSSEANTLNHIAGQVVIWGLLICFIFGSFGFLSNIYVFTRPSLRGNPCSMYFLSSSVAGLIFLLVSVPFRVLQYGFNIDPTYYLLGFCKTEYYIIFSAR
jgi:hypothetical protein